MTTGQPSFTHGPHGRTASNPNDRLNDRLIGRYGDDRSGPLLIVVAGIHGNEHRGVEAAARVLERLLHERPRFRGRLVAFRGNLAALAAHERFIDRDLNRMWEPSEAEALLSQDPADDDTEARQLREIHECIDREVEFFDCDTEGVEREAEGVDRKAESSDRETGGEWSTSRPVASRAHRPWHPIALLDVHSTSAVARPFCIVSDTIQNRRIAFALRIPVILGLEETLQGTIHEYYGDRGYVTAAVEGGQHDDPETADYLESALWMSLIASGNLRDADLADLVRHRERLRHAGRNAPPVVEVVHRHAITVEDQFRMNDGLDNFHPVRAGQVVARDRRGEVKTPVGGMLLMPNRQNIGDDGFFVCRRVQMMWLRLSALCRRLRLERLLPFLPGVRMHPSEKATLLVDPSRARWLMLEVFHVLGFRKCPSQNGACVFRRRFEGEGNWV